MFFKMVAEDKLIMFIVKESYFSSAELLYMVKE